MLNKDLHRQKLINILKDIFESDIWKYLAFKWWTACYFLHSLDRFSTDLDFDLIWNIENIDKKLEKILLKHWKLKKWNKIILSYGDNEDNIKIDISRNIRKSNNYETVNLFWIDIKVQDKATIFANKLIALTDRNSLANRDFYDIYFFFKNNFEINEEVIKERTSQEEWKKNNNSKLDFLSKNEYFKYLQYFIENEIPKNHKILDGLWEVLQDEKHKSFVKNKLLNELLIILKDKQKFDYIENWIIITKSLFVDYKEFPKVAWWKQNSIDTYKKIKWLESEEQEITIMELGQKVEDLVWEYFLKVEWVERLDVFWDNSAFDNQNEDDTDMIIIQESYKEKRERNLKQTIEAIKNKEPLIYQPWFLIDNLFVRWDYLKLNANWKYDLYEVKAKTWVRKDKIFEWNKNKNVWELEDKFLYDISFQKYVINKVLEKENLWELWEFYFAYLNWNYKKSWSIELKKIIILDEVNTKKEVVLEWEENEKIIEISDYLLSPLIIEESIKSIKNELILNEEEFNKIHTFSWSKYLEYFWKDREFWTIFWKWLTSPKAVKELYKIWKTNLEDLTLEEQELFNKTDGSIWGARQYIINYLKAKKTWKDIIDKESIKLELDDLKYPICFYDYESCSVPVPFLDNVSPYQHAMVQYSMHKVYEDWKIEHFGWVLVWTWEKSVKQIDIKNNKNKVDFESEKVITWWYKDLLLEFLKDIWDDLDKTFIVWYSPFENTRNKEIAETFSDLKKSFEMINQNTYDLMDIFSKWYYYSLKCKWSNSIKYVLPALVPEMSYKDMEVPNWLIAMQTLNQIIEWKITWDEKEKQIKNLLIYCGQDSLAMYRIYERIIESLI